MLFRSVEPGAKAGAKAGTKPKKVVDLMEALRESLAAVTAKGHRAKMPAKRVKSRAAASASTRQRARVLEHPARKRHAS